jgi:deoxyadenosine/deoxycytidine kinase
LKEKLGDEIEFHLEPLEKWQNCHGTNLLQLMYEDPKKYTFLLQSYIQLTMAQIQMKTSIHPIKVTERSLLSERFIFIQNLINHKLISDSEHSVLVEYFEFLNNLVPKVDEIIYLRTNPELAYSQLKLRARKEEKSIPFSLIQDLHKLHEDWLIHRTIGSLNGAKIYEVNQNFNVLNTNQVFSDIVSRLKDRIR